MASKLKGILGVALFAFVVLVSASPVLAGPPQRFVVFGDSLSDPGNAFILTRDLEVPPFTSLIPDAPYARGALHFSRPHPEDGFVELCELGVIVADDGDVVDLRGHRSGSWWTRKLARFRAAARVGRKNALLR